MTETQPAKRPSSGLSEHPSAPETDGNDAVVEATATPMRSGDRIIGSVIVWHDVTQQQKTKDELKGAEAALRESESLLRSFFDSPGLLRGIVEIEGDSVRFVSLSTAAAQLYGLPMNEVRGKSALELGVPQAVTDVWLEHYRKAYHTGRHVTFELQREVQDSELWFACTVSYLGDGPGGLSRFAYVMADISEIKAAAQALEAANARLEESDRRKNEFLAALSHELRNPLAPIKNSLYVLDRAAPGGEQAARAKAIIDRQVTQLSNLVDELLDVTRVTRNKIQLQTEHLDLADVVGRVVEDYRSLFESSQLHLKLVTTGVAVHVMADRTRIVQVVGNLLQNAAKFSQPGGRTRVSLSSHGPRAIISVADDRAGMDAAILGRLFEPFMQADKTLDRSKGGLGLGLALVKGLVELHGGDVAAHSAGLGKGSEVVVRLPLASVSAPVEAQPGRARARRRRRILIIEDNLDAASSLCEVLQLAEHDVTVAHIDQKRLMDLVANRVSDRRVQKLPCAGKPHARFDRGSCQPNFEVEERNQVSTNASHLSPARDEAVAQVQGHRTKYLVSSTRMSWAGAVVLLVACSCGDSSGPRGKSTDGSVGTGGIGSTGGVLGSDGGVDSAGGHGGSGTVGTDGGGTESGGGLEGHVDASIAEAGGPVGGLDGGGVDASAGEGGVDTGVEVGEPDAPTLRGDDFVTDVKITVHPQTSTILQVTWTQLAPADTTSLEFSFADSPIMASRPRPGALGGRRDVVLGVPEKTVVAVRIVNRLSGMTYKTVAYQGTTGALPSSLPRPQVLAYEPSLASPERFMLGAVDGSPGGCGDVFSCYYLGPYWIYIMDRQGRIVWYWADMSDNASSAYPRVARDGEYIVVDKGRGGKTGVVKMTLDRQYYQFTAIEELDDAIDVTSDGSVLYDANGELFELTKQGTTRSIWSCTKYFGPSFWCYSNTVNWVAADDSVLLSFPTPCVVVQVSRKSGTLLGVYGNVGGSYAFSPSPWRLEFPHSPTITPEGTLLVSAHLPGYPDGTAAGPSHHAFEEFSIDRAAKTLTQTWIYSDGPEWAAAKGFALRLPNGNTLANYGTGGVIREITPDKQTVFDVRFAAQEPNANPYFGRMVGNLVYVDDLYALNGGPVQ